MTSEQCAEEEPSKHSSRVCQWRGVIDGLALLHTAFCGLFQKAARRQHTGLTAGGPQPPTLGKGMGPV